MEQGLNFMPSQIYLFYHPPLGWAFVRRFGQIKEYAADQNDKSK